MIIYFYVQRKQALLFSGGERRGGVRNQSWRKAEAIVGTVRPFGAPRHLPCALARISGPSGRR